MDKKLKRKIIFPLEMKDGKKVYSLDELRDNFSVSQIQHHFLNGRLEVWLSDRHLEELAEQIRLIQKEDENALVNVCEVLGITLDEVVMNQIEELKSTSEKEDADNIISLKDETEKLEEIENSDIENETDEPLIFWDTQGIYLDDSNEIREVLRHEHYEAFFNNYESDLAAEGNYVYLKCRVKQYSKQYEIRRYDVRDLSMKVICTLEEPETNGISINNYSIFGVRGDTLYCGAHNRLPHDLMICTITISTGEIEEHHIQQEKEFNEFNKNIYMNAKIDVTGKYIYTSNQGNLMEIDLTHNVSKCIFRYSGSNMKVNLSNHNAFVLLSGDDVCIVNVNKHTRKNIKWSSNQNAVSGYIDVACDMCYCSGKVYVLCYQKLIPFFVERQTLHLREYDLNTGQKAIIKLNLGELNVNCMEIRNNKIFLFRSYGRHEYFPEVQIDIGTWTAKKLKRTSTSLFFGLGTTSSKIFWEDVGELCISQSESPVEITEGEF